MSRAYRFFLLRWARDYYESFFYFFLLILAFSIPTSRLLMSMSQLALASLWILDGRYLIKLRQFFQNRIAWILTLLYVLHFVGLFYSDDKTLAMTDLRIKLPLFLLPFFFSSIRNLGQRKAAWVLFAFVTGAVYASAFVSVEHWIGSKSLEVLLSDRFIKHMRFSLFINFAIFILIYLGRSNMFNRSVQGAIVVVILWLIFFMFQLGALSAYVLFLVFSLYFILETYRKKSHGMLLFAVLVIAGFLIALVSITDFILPEKQAVSIDSLDKKTTQGNDYYHLPNDVFENGKPIYIYVCEKELNREWSKRSSLSFYGKDVLGQELKATLIRYLNSLDLRKDSAGMAELSAKDIKQIENGTANIQYVSKTGFQLRLMQFAFELEQYKNNPNPSGYSLGQRLEYWKVAWNRIQKNLYFGSGTGDNDLQMKKGYIETESKLNPDLWFRPHNQFLSIWLAFGLIGLLVFIGVLILPFTSAKQSIHPLFWYFFISILLSFLVEDTLETQSGATYYAFFTAFFLMLWSIPKKKDTEM
ncbi:MAG: O-antigen ligase family protein [Bacteroidales bacterium]|nr:O-antigen ligase family protein [Bacteroidales bacterium]